MICSGEKGEKAAGEGKERRGGGAERWRGNKWTKSSLQEAVG